MALGIAALVAVGLVAAFWNASARADGRTLTGDFCTTPAGSMFCMTVDWGGVLYGTTNRADLQLRPGTYWITVNDDSSMHDFALRSCPGETSACDQNSDGTSMELTGVAETGTVTEKILLTQGTYRLYCDVGGASHFHEVRGMYVDFEVGGVGQIG